MVKLYLPTGPTSTSEGPSVAPAQRPCSLEGARVGIVNNRWACMETLTGFYQEQLTRSFGVSEVEVHSMAATEWLHEPDLDRYAERWDAAIVGMGH